jgi:hypothetical protein
MIVVGVMVSVDREFEPQSGHTKDYKIYLIFSPLSEVMWSCKCFLHVRKIPTLTYKRAKSVIIENAIIMNNILHTSLKIVM